MKKIIALLLCITMALSLSACCLPIDDFLSQMDGISGVIPEKPFSKGTIDGDVYNNDFAQITFTKPSDWTFDSEDKMNELEEEGTICGFSARSGTGENVMICFQNIGVAASAVTTLDEFVELLIEELENMGYVVENLGKQEFKGQTYAVLTGEITHEGITVYQKYFICKKGAYIPYITITALNEDDISDMEDMFS